MSFFDFLTFVWSSYTSTDDNKDTDDDSDSDSDDEELGNLKKQKQKDPHELEKILQTNGWFETVLLLKNSILLDVARSNEDWCEARGYLVPETNEIQLEDNLVEIIFDEDGSHRERKSRTDFVEWENLLIHCPMNFPNDGEVFIVFGDKKSLKDNSFEKTERFSKENVIRCNGQSTTYISNLINQEKGKHNNSFLLIYRDDGEKNPLVRFTRILCDNQPIALIWAKQLVAFETKDVVDNQWKMNQQQIPSDRNTFLKNHRFVIFKMSDEANQADGRVDVIIVNENCAWARLKTIVLHKLKPQQIKF